MRIDRLELKNFRQFRERSVSFSPAFNVLIGDNGTGKTTILDALSVAVGSFFLGIDNQPTRSIRADEVRLNVFDYGGELTREYASAVAVTAEGEVAGHRIYWARSLRGEGRHTTYGEARKMKEVARELQEEVREKRDTVLPLIAYHATGRMWLQRSRSRRRKGLPESRFRGYDDCLNIQSNDMLVREWWRDRELSALQRDEPIALLRGVKAAISSAMEDWRRVWYDLALKDFVARNDTGEILPTRVLSDGQRNVLTLVTELAYRAAVLNPMMGDSAHRETPGVVLIDELDLHLHPRWQRRIVEDLRRTFPRLQFIVTTHSPLIIQSLRPGELIDLGGTLKSEYVNRSPEDIYENVMGESMPQRSERSQKMIEVAEEYYSLLRNAAEANEEQRTKLKLELDKLIEPYADNEAYVALLRTERIASGLDAQQS